jgi:tetratricopeptide (TPR) repeat protein
MSDTSRIDDLRRRVQSDPASIAFAQLAEEYRRQGLWQEAVETCRTGLARHPGYLSARVTLGRALKLGGDLDAAETELEQVLQTSPDNLAALRTLADLHRERGSSAVALGHYRAALALAPNDPELEQRVEALAGTVAEQSADSSRVRAAETIAALEQWLAAVHVTRAERRA